jgi:hypothetical protein
MIGIWTTYNTTPGSRSIRVPAYREILKVKREGLGHDVINATSLFLSGFDSPLDRTCMYIRWFGTLRFKTAFNPGEKVYVLSKK